MIITHIPCTRRILNYNLLTDIVITENEELDQYTIRDSSKSYGPDHVPPKLLKKEDKKSTNLSAVCLTYPREHQSS